MRSYSTPNSDYGRESLLFLSSVITFATRCGTDLDRLDFLVENTVVVNLHWKPTQGGHEECLQVNALSTGLFGVLLLPLWARSAPEPAGEGSQPFEFHLTIVESDGKPSRAESLEPFYSEDNSRFDPARVCRARIRPPHPAQVRFTFA